MGEEPYLRGTWEYFSPRKKQSKEVSRGGRRRKAGRNDKVSGSRNRQPKSTWNK